MHPQSGLFLVLTQQVKAVDAHPTRWTLDLKALARQAIEPLALMFECGIHGGNLVNVSHKTTEDVRQSRQPRRIGGSGLNNLPLPIPSGSALAETTHHLIALVRIEQIAAHLGGMAETEWQQAGGQGIQIARVPALGSTKQLPHLLQGLVAGKSQGLVQ